MELFRQSFAVLSMQLFEDYFLFREVGYYLLLLVNLLYLL